jgi:hypothetical protein
MQPDRLEVLRSRFLAALQDRAKLFVGFFQFRRGIAA